MAASFQAVAAERFQVNSLVEFRAGANGVKPTVHFLADFIALDDGGVYYNLQGLFQRGDKVQGDRTSFGTRSCRTSKGRVAGFEYKRFDYCMTVSKAGSGYEVLVEISSLADMLPDSKTVMLQDNVGMAVFRVTPNGQTCKSSLRRSTLKQVYTNSAGKHTAGGSGGKDAVAGCTRTAGR